MYIYLLLKSGNIKRINDSRYLEDEISSKVKYVMIPVGINDEEYMLLDPKKMVKRLDYCKIETELGVYVIDIDYDEKPDSDLLQLTGRQEKMITTIGELYSYIASINRINSYNNFDKLDDDVASFYSTTIDFAYFRISIKSDYLTKDFTSIYDPDIMPLMIENVSFIKKKLKKLFYTPLENFSKERICVTSDKKWYIKKVENEYKSEVESEEIYYENLKYFNETIYPLNKEAHQIYYDMIKSIEITYYLYNKEEVAIHHSQLVGISYDPDEVLKPEVEYNVRTYISSDFLVLISIFSLFHIILTFLGIQYEIPTNSNPKDYELCCMMKITTKKEVIKYTFKNTDEVLKFSSNEFIKILLKGGE